MTPEQKRQRQSLILGARAAVYGAMSAFTKQEGELTVAEWAEVFLAILQRNNAEELKEEWSASP